MCFAVDRCLVGAFDSAQVGGGSGFLEGDGFAVLPAEGADGEGLAFPLDVVGVGFAVGGAAGDGVNGGGGGGVVEGKGESPAFGIVVGQGDDRLVAGSRCGLLAPAHANRAALLIPSVGEGRI